MTVSRIRILVLGLWALAAAWYFLYPGTTLQVSPALAGSDLAGNTLFWFKGNTHSHARISFQDYAHGDSSPVEVAGWYRDHGYHFIAITDHNRFEDGIGLNSPDTQSPEFLVVPGMEITSDYRYPGVNQDGERRIHATALNVRRSVDWDFKSPDKTSIIRQQARRIREQGGLHILNHPNYRFQVELRDILDAENVRLFELYNAHPRSNHSGHQGFRPSVEDLWDQVLDSGKLLYGIASDDAHDFKKYRSILRYFGSAPPGGAWVMVRANKLDTDSITSALENGDFYSTTGVYLKNVSTSENQYRVELDMERTRQEVKQSWIRSAAPKVWSDDSHFVIEFIGSHGRVLGSAHNQPEAGIELHESQGFVRARVTYLEKIFSITGADKARAYFAWTQPVMTSGQE